MIPRILAVLIAVFVLGTAPPWISRQSIPHLVNDLGGVCSSVVIALSVLFTAGHCVKSGGATLAVDYGDGRHIPVEVVCVADRTDFAVLSADIPVGIPFIEIDELLPRLGEQVWIVAWPRGKFQSMLGTVRGMLEDVEIQSTSYLSPRTVPRMIMVGDKDNIVAKGGVSGGGMFSESGKYLGTAIAYTIGNVGVIPVEDGIKECPLSRKP